MLADLIKRSKNCCAYTGAGISTSSGISDYATRATDSKAVRPALMSPFDAEPTLAHRVLTGMYNAGYLKHWVQQNHDGLPQKAGYPQHALNEIHGTHYSQAHPCILIMTGRRIHAYRS